MFEVRQRLLLHRGFRVLFSAGVKGKVKGNDGKPDLRPVAPDQMRTVESSPTEAKSSSSGLHATPDTSVIQSRAMSVCELYIVT